MGIIDTQSKEHMCNKWHTFTEYNAVFCKDKHPAPITEALSDRPDEWHIVQCTA